MLRAASNHGSVRAATEWRNSRSGSRFRKPSPFAYRWGLLSRAASDHVSARAAPHRWYGHNESRFRKHHSRVPYKWGLLLCSIPNNVSVRAVPHRWYSHNGSRFRKRSSPFPCRWGLLHGNAPDHGYLGLFRRIPYHTPHRPLWWCRLLCHRYTLQYQLRGSSSCSCGCACRCRRMTTRPMRDRRSNSLRKYCTFPECRRSRSRRCSFQSLLRCSACICGCACRCWRS